MFTLKNLANAISLIGTGCGLFFTSHKLLKLIKVNLQMIFNHTMGLNIFANSCFLYMIVNEQWFIMTNCLSVITLEGSLMFMKYNFKDIKKSASGTSLVDMVLLKKMIFKNN